MVKHYLEFEKPLIELEREIENLKRFSRGKPIHFNEQLKGLEEKLYRLQKEIFSNLTGWQITQLARHIDRPKASHYVQWMFENFVELHGDRNYRRRSGDPWRNGSGLMEDRWPSSPIKREQTQKRWLIGISGCLIRRDIVRP